MIEFTPAIAGELRRAALLEEWTAQLEAGALSTCGLRRLRARLDATSGEFEPGPDLELLEIAVNDELAERLGVPAGLMPGRSPTPDWVPEGL